MGGEIFWEIIRTVVAPVATACVTFLVTKIKATERQRQLEKESTEKMKREQMETTATLKEGIKILLRRNIKEDCEEYLAKGSCTAEEREELVEAYNLYTSLGGNHTIPQYMKKVEKLPFHSPHQRN